MKKAVGITVIVTLLLVTIGNVGISVVAMNKVNQTKKDVAVSAEPEQLTEKTTEEKITDVAVDPNSFSRDIIKTYFEEDGRGALGLLRDMYPEKVVYYDGKYCFADLNKDLKASKVDKSNISFNKKGDAVYKVDKEVVSKKGIDVSAFQGDIDWKKVKADGIDFAIIRLGYRGYGSGAIVEDEKAIQNLRGATRAGVDIGVYFFSMAVDEEEAAEEAEFMLKMIKKYDITYPVIYDTEEIPNDTYRTENLTSEQRTKNMISFCETVKDAGYTPMIYSNIKWFVSTMNLEELEDYPKWFAYYGDDYYYPYDVDLWQYSCTGKVDGIEGDVDLNIDFCFE